MQNHKTVSENIKQEIAKAQNILLISHQKPDGDTLGSNLALLTYLQTQNKNITSFCLDPIPKSLKFLPNGNLLNNDHKVFTKKYDIVIVLDSGSLDYAGVNKLITALPLGYKLINIDHHITNPLYGDINLVITSASSTAEILYRLFKDWQVDWNSDIATNLSCGMITDTGGFKNAATGYHCLYAASEMMINGAQPHNIIKSALSNTNIDNLRIWGLAMERLSRSKKYELVYTWLTQEDFKEYGVDDSAAEGLTNFLHVLKDAKVILLLTELPNNTIKGSMRTTSEFDLTKLAKLFGGGGHKKAAGFSLPGRMVCDNNKLQII
jgi:bifunctional oligoribonuclease and PAP phosphatase NrnA